MQAAKKFTAEVWKTGRYRRHLLFSPSVKTQAMSQLSHLLLQDSEYTSSE
jgi:hypothetical protein